MIDLAIAERLVGICGDLNDNHGVTHRAGNVSARVIMPEDAPGNPGCPVVLFAGSNDLKDWGLNADCDHVDFGYGFGKVHEGFYTALRRIMPQLLEELGMFTEVCFAGHSQGGAIATLAAAEFTARGYTVKWVYTFGSPRPASKGFKATYDRLGLGALTYRVVVGYDVVVRCPDRSIDYHLGQGHFFDESGDRRAQQPRPKWYAPWRYFTQSIWNHMALSSYLTAVRRAGDQ